MGVFNENISAGDFAPSHGETFTLRSPSSGNAFNDRIGMYSKCIGWKGRAFDSHVSTKLNAVQGDIRVLGMLNTNALNSRNHIPPCIPSTLIKRKLVIIIIGFFHAAEHDPTNRR